MMNAYMNKIYDEIDTQHIHRHSEGICTICTIKQMHAECPYKKIFLSFSQHSSQYFICDDFNGKVRTDMTHEETARMKKKIAICNITASFY